MISRTYKSWNRRFDTKVDKLISVLSDGKWHSTKELVRRVGHAFGCARHALAKTGIRVERRPHKRQRWQHQYRIDLDNPFDTVDPDNSTQRQNDQPR